jgi:hypothetical protein
MIVKEFVPRELTEMESDIRLAALHMALGFVALDPEMIVTPDDTIEVAETFRQFLMGHPIAKQG